MAEGVKAHQHAIETTLLEELGETEERERMISFALRRCLQQEVEQWES